MVRGVDNPEEKHEYLARILIKKHIANIERDAKTAFDTFKILEDQDNADREQPDDPWE